MPKLTHDDVIEKIKRLFALGTLPLISGQAVVLGIEERDAGNPTGDASLVVYDGLSGGVSVTLPAAASHAGKVLVIFNADAAEDVTVLAQILQTGEAVVVFSDGAAWRIVTSNATGT